MLCQMMQLGNARSLLKSEKGFLLIAALTLLTALTLVGTTAYILSSTDIKIGGNFRNSQMVLQVAMAGTEKAREALRLENLASNNKTSFSDELNSSTRKGANGALNGYSATTDDIPLASGTMNNGSVSYAAYLSNDSAEGFTNTTDNNGKVMITSVATGPNNSKAQVQTVLTLATPPSGPGTLYSKDNVTLNGSSINISGNDSGNCGGTGMAAVYTKDPATTIQNGNPVLSGTPSAITHGTQDIDIESYIDQLRTSATVTLTNDVSGGTYGSATNFVTVFADAVGTQADHELRLNNVTGHGILLVKGDLQLAGNIEWHGLIFVTGVISASGGGSDSKNIQGLVFTGASSLGDTDISGSVTIGYNSCDVKLSMAGQPFQVTSWKQSY
jgi:Tfp pilus assembly protein PilX